MTHTIHELIADIRKREDELDLYRKYKDNLLTKSNDMLFEEAKSSNQLQFLIDSTWHGEDGNFLLKTDNHFETFMAERRAKNWPMTFLNLEDAARDKLFRVLNEIRGYAKQS